MATATRDHPEAHRRGNGLNWRHSRPPGVMVNPCACGKLERYPGLETCYRCHRDSKKTVKRQPRSKPRFRCVTYQTTLARQKRGKSSPSAPRAIQGVRRHSAETHQRQEQERAASEWGAQVFAGFRALYQQRRRVVTEAMLRQFASAGRLLLTTGDVIVKDKPIIEFDFVSAVSKQPEGMSMAA